MEAVESGEVEGDRSREIVMREIEVSETVEREEGGRERTGEVVVIEEEAFEVEETSEVW